MVTKWETLGANALAAKKDEWTPLHIAAQKNHARIAEELIKNLESNDLSLRKPNTGKLSLLWWPRD